MTLRDLRPGEHGVITGFTGDTLPTRLLEMGMLPGESVEVLRLAPFGDPMDLRVRGYRLSVRKEDASQVRIDRRP